MRAEVLSLISLSAVACGRNEVLIPPGLEDSPRRSLSVRERLVEPQLFELEVGESAMALAAPHRRLVHEVPLEPAAARVAAAATERGALRLSEISVPFEPIPIAPEAFAPDGASVEGLVLQLAFLPLETTWTADAEDRAHFQGAARLHADWQLTTARGTLDARPVDVPQVPVSGSIALDSSGGLVLELQCSSSGALIDWGGLLVVSDLRLSLTFAEVLPNLDRRP